MMISGKPRVIGLTIMAALVFAAAPATAGENSGRAMMRSLGGKGLEGKALDKAIAKAEAHPLGTRDNPVRENMPEGEQAYLDRLRCADGATPQTEREGNVGIGVYGYIVDLYKVTCPGQPAIDVYMDMYHDGPENRPVPGFTMAGETPA